MMIARLLRESAIAVGAVVACVGLQAAPASAQLFWDWGGGSTVGGSGRENVRFNPQFKKGEIIVSFGDRRLYFITAPGQAISYPIATPRDESRWQGATTITSKRVNPSWTPTPTMMAENPRLPRWVPGGHPMNPLGVRALYLGSSTYRIHGTDAPWTIGTNVSKGCIRMYNQDVLDLYPRAQVGTKVTVTYQRFDGFASSSPMASAPSAPPPANTKGGATKASSTTSSNNNSGGGLFDWLYDDPPPQKPRRRVTRAKSASSE
jgi:lipoprotein-anchoring transpeptidase ErfK/SrfK